ncbi:MAG TPA: von Willebrand factor type A domain-containing protein [Euzebya sp.]|nr:von Willebrand factor type A domain-containing protein [Euzebya sp.]
MTRHASHTRLAAAALLTLALVASGCSSDKDPADGALSHTDGSRPNTSAGSLDAPIDRDEASAGIAATDDGEAEQDAAMPGAATPGALAHPLPDDEPVEPERPTTGLNPFVATAVDHLSTFGLDVDTVSYTRIRQALLERGTLPDPVEVRIEEVVNAVDYGYDADPSATFTVTADGAAWPWGTADGTFLLRIGITTPTPERRDATNLVFVVDTSGSMDRPDRLPLARQALGVLVENLTAADTVAIVTYDDTARPVLPPTPADQPGVILDAIDQLTPGGSTNLAGGLELGYQLARDMADDGQQTRVIILSDGIANVGNSTPEAVLAQIGDHVRDGIDLTTVGFGLTFNDPLMEQVADQGNGVAVYIDGLQEAQRVFGQQLTATLQTIAMDARVQVDFNAELIDSYRLIGYENRDIADEDFRDPDTDAGEIGAGHAVTALYEVRLADRDPAKVADGDIAVIQLRWVDPADGRTTETAFGVPVTDLTHLWDEATASLRLAGTAAAWAETLRGSPHTTADLAQLAGEADRIAAFVPDQPQVAELADLIQRSAQL